MPDPLPQRGTVLGFDFGLARIGVATGELETRHASPLTTIHAEKNDERFKTIADLIREWTPVLLVVGIPCHLDGREHELTARCRRFANQLRGRFNLPVAQCDERLSSHSADTLLRDAGVHHWQSRKPNLDAVAAQIIVQHYLDQASHAQS